MKKSPQVRSGWRHSRWWRHSWRLCVERHSVYLARHSSFVDAFFPVLPVCSSRRRWLAAVVLCRHRPCPLGRTRRLAGAGGPAPRVCPRRGSSKRLSRDRHRHTSRAWPPATRWRHRHVTGSGCRVIDVPRSDRSDSPLALHNNASTACRKRNETCNLPCDTSNWHIRLTVA